MTYVLPDAIREQMNEVLSGPFPGNDDPEHFDRATFNAEVERRIAAAEQIRLTWEQSQAQAAYGELTRLGVSEEIATRLAGLQTPPGGDGA